MSISTHVSQIPIINSIKWKHIPMLLGKYPEAVGQGRSS